MSCLKNNSEEEKDLGLDENRDGFEMRHQQKERQEKQTAVVERLQQERRSDSQRGRERLERVASKA